jgi:hypothetical protein
MAAVLRAVAIPDGREFKKKALLARPGAGVPERRASRDMLLRDTSLHMNTLASIAQKLLGPLEPARRTFFLRAEAQIRAKVKELTAGAAAGAAATEPSAEAFEMLVSMGFAPAHARLALAHTDQNLERAADWLCLHAGDLDGVVAALSGAAGGASGSASGSASGKASASSGKISGSPSCAPPMSALAAGKQVYCE